jgi:hypothetical protein
MLIDKFLSQKRFAMIGVSRNPRDFSRGLFREFLERGYDVLPVNPQAGEIEGREAFHTIREVSPPVTCALLMVSIDALERVLQYCDQAGIRLVWIYGIVGSRSVDPAILKYCEDHGIEVIAGFCPYMFLPHTESFHRFHGWVWKMMGFYPN